MVLGMALYIHQSLVHTEEPALHEHAVVENQAN